MLRYIGRRLLQLIPVFLGATFLIYLMVFALPGDPLMALAGEKVYHQQWKKYLEQDIT